MDFLSFFRPKETTAGKGEMKQEAKPYGLGIAPGDPLTIEGVVMPPGLSKPASDRELVLQLEDVLPRIPTHFLCPGLHDPLRELRFPLSELAAGLERGNPTVRLADLADRCPEIFARPEAGQEETRIFLPLQKLVQQLAAPLVAPSAIAKKGQAPEPAIASSGAAPPAVSVPQVTPPAPADLASLGEESQRPLFGEDRMSPDRPEQGSVPPPLRFASGTEAHGMPRFPLIRPPIIPPAAKPLETVREDHPGDPPPPPLTAPSDPANLDASPPPLQRRESAPLEVRPPPLSFAPPATRPREPLLPFDNAPRVEQEPLQAIFMTEGHLDLPRVSELSASLPGIAGCMIMAGETLVHTGERPAGLDAAALRALSARLVATTDLFAAQLPADHDFTLYGGNRALSIFARESLCLCVVHQTRGFLPGVRERLLAVADALARRPAN